MKYLRNIDLAKEYSVSVRAVANWIESARNGKINLDLYHDARSGKTYVANNARNIVRIGLLVENGRKYRTKKAHRVIEPRPEFYEVYSTDQIVDLVDRMKYESEAPRQYNYFGEGAYRWSENCEKQLAEATPNILAKTIELLEDKYGYFAKLFDEYDRVNIIDVGPGNALPVKNFLTFILESKKLGTYSAVDISPAMLKIAESNIRKWFGGRVRFEAIQRDVSHQRFKDVLTRSQSRDGRSLNIVLFLGGTLDNLKDHNEVLQVFRQSMRPEDLLVFSTKSQASRKRLRYFEFNVGDMPQKLSPNHKHLFELLNIDESLYEAHTGYDEHEGMGFVRIRFNLAVTLRLRADSGLGVIDFNKGDELLVLRIWYKTSLRMLEIFDQAGFELLQASVTDDGEYLLNIHRVKLATP